MATQKLNLTRDQLATFLKNHEQIKQFENLFALADEVSTASDTQGISIQAGNADAAANEALAQIVRLAQDASINSSAADQKAVQALDTLSRIANALEMLATAPVIQNNNSVVTDYIDLPEDGPHVTQARRVQWNQDDGTMDVGLYGGSVLQVGQELMFYSKNTSGSLIANGTPVMFTGTIGSSGKLTFGLAVADGTVPADYMMGVATQDIADNEFGYVTSFGLVRGFNTTGAPYSETWNDGDLLYFGTASPGTWTKVQPIAPRIDVPVAVVVNAGSGGSGSIFVRMTIAESLARLQDVYISGLANGDLLQYDSVQQRWENIPASTLPVGTATNLAGGAAGSVPYQSAPGTTTFLPVGTALQVFKVNAGATAPEWVSGAALTKIDDTNVTLTLGGAPATSLLAATSLTLGWMGQLAVGRGGTGVNTTPTNGQLLIGNGAGYTVANLTAGSGVSISNSAGGISISATGTGGTVTSVGLSAPTGFSVGGSPVTSSGTLALSFSAGYSLPTTASQTNWDTAYTDRLKWDGGSTGLVAATGRTSLGATTVGSNLFTLANPSAVTYTRINADNSVSTLDAATFRTAIGAGTGNGTVTGVTASAPLASSGGTAPNITITGSALTKTDDTNVTLTLGGSPTTALLAAASLTLGWTGQLAVGRGGTGLSSLTAGYIPYGNGTGAFSSSSNLYFSGTNLGLGTTSPDVFGRGYGRIFGINSASNAAIEMNSATGNGVFFDMGVAGSRTFNIYSDTTSGAVSTIGARVLSIGTNSTPAIVIDTSQNVFPNTDNAKTLGAAGNRWSVVYAGTGTINTSDARHKTAVSNMTANELAAATELAREIGTFKFISALAEKGEGARLHIGMTVQRAIEIMQFHGLDPMIYGFICYDEWDRSEIKIAARRDEDGNVLEEEQIFATEAGNRYGFRTDELLLFIARGFEERLTSIERQIL